MSSGSASEAEAEAGAEPITTVVCDFFGVLTSPLKDAFDAVRVALDLSANELNEAMGRVHTRTGSFPLFELECGRMREAEFHALLDEELERALGRPTQMGTFNEHYFGALRVNTPVVDAIRRARQAGYRTSLLTNNVREWEPYWRAMFPVDELFEDVVDSAYVGMRKPDRAIFELTCARLEVEAASCVFVDDFAHNCDAARELGMTAVWFQETDQAVAELEAVLAERGAPAAGD